MEFHRCHRCLKIVARSKEMLTAPSSVGCHWEWLLLRRDDPVEERRLQDTLELMTRDMLHKKTEAWQTCGALTMVTFSVTQYWNRFICKCSTQPMLKLEQNVTHRKRKSSTTFQTWMQISQSEESTTFGHQALFPRKLMETSHSKLQWDPASVLQTISWQRQTSSAPCMNVSSCVRTRRQNLPFFAHVVASAESPHPQSARSHNSSRETSCGNLR